jgi:hypothetical protein
MTVVLISVHSAEGFVVLCVVVLLEIERVLTGFLIGLNNLFQSIKKPVRTLSIFKDANGISFG